MSNIALYTIGALLIIVSPGPDFVYVLTRGIAHGRVEGILSACGIALGLLLHTLFAAIGLTAILIASDLVFKVVRYLGAVYLVYLGLKMLYHRTIVVTSQPLVATSSLSIVRQGMLTNLLNPKALLTFMAFIPQFVSRGDAQEVILLGVIIALLAIAWFSFVGYFAGAIRTWMIHSPLAQYVPYAITGILFVLGLRVVSLV
jgi:threonine/homoserine/homoserine lactone efflux protein